MMMMRLSDGISFITCLAGELESKQKTAVKLSNKQTEYVNADHDYTNGEDDADVNADHDFTNGAVDADVDAV